jgi:hypothetical protein
MKRTLSILVLLSLCALPVLADDPPPPPLTPPPAGALADTGALIAELRRTEARFLDAVSGLTEAQWNYKPAPDRWSIAECAEHIAAAEPLIRSMIADAMKADLAADALAGAHQDGLIKKGLVDRSQKFKAPEPLIPTNRYKTPEGAINAFKRERGETIALAGGETDLRARGSKHFLFGPLDAYGWFLFQSGHSERHTLQIEEVKTTAGYPK